MTRALFGTDGVRGIAGEYPLDQAGTISIGRALGTHFAKQGQQVVIGWDPRASSSEIVDNMVAGLNQVGVDVVMLGVVPTPGLAYTTRENEQFVAGIMVTASHNPVQYNGVKAFDANGDKLTDETEAKLNKLIKDGVEDRGQGTSRTDESLVAAYLNFLIGSAGGTDLSGLKIAIDCANGASSTLATVLFESLGARVEGMFNTPDGSNINAGCGATHPEALAQHVIDGKFDLGIALDGDADRILLIDEHGRELNGDHIIYILAVSRNLPGVVMTVMTNLGAEQSLESKGVKVVRAKVGDRYVLEHLAKTGYSVGGEQAGHIILYDLLATGDGLLAAVQALVATVKSGKTLAEWRDEVKLLPQTLVNIPLDDKTLLDREVVQEYVHSQEEKLNKKGRLLIRPSGTEPIARVMVEAPDAESRANRIAEKLAELLKEGK